MAGFSTQDFLPIDDIKDDIVVLKDGSMSMVLQTSAVNFDLLSETEQLAIIGSFAAMLNSLSFAIQIVIQSKRLDISHYLHILKEAEDKQNNPLMKLMMQHYRQFVTNIIKNNEVLDKQFYVVITVSYLELGVVKNVGKNFDKGLTLLAPRRDHIIRQLGRIGLKSTQLTTEKLLEIFYDEFNDTFKASIKSMDSEEVQLLNQTVRNLNAQAGQIVQQPTPAPNPNPPPSPIQQPAALFQTPPQMQQPPIAAAPSQVQPSPQSPQMPQSYSAPQPPTQTPQPRITPQAPVNQSFALNRAAPFIVEELPDDYGTV